MVPGGRLYKITTPEEIARIYPLHLNHVKLCPSTPFTLDEFTAMMLERLLDPSIDLWIYEEPDGTIGSYQLTQVVGLILRIICGVYHPDVTLYSALRVAEAFHKELAMNTGCITLHWTCHKSATDAIELMTKYANRLLVPKFEINPDIYEFELKL
jgi:hypothetical protein